MKKILSFIIAVTFLIASTLSISVSAAQSGVCGDNLTYTLDDNGLLTITGTGTMYDEVWCFNYDGIKKVVVEEGVTNVGVAEFMLNETINEVILPEGLTQIGDSAFHTSNIKSIVIPKSVTDIGRLAFFQCFQLTDIYYGGTAEDWNKINIGENNDMWLTTDKIHYESIGANSDNTQADVNSAFAGEYAPQSATMYTEDGLLKLNIAVSDNMISAINQGLGLMIGYTIDYQHSENADSYAGTVFQNITDWVIEGGSEWDIYKEIANLCLENSVETADNSYTVYLTPATQLDDSGNNNEAENLQMTVNATINTYSAKNIEVSQSKADGGINLSVKAEGAFKAGHYVVTHKTDDSEFDVGECVLNSDSETISVSTFVENTYFDGGYIQGFEDGTYIIYNVKDVIISGDGRNAALNIDTYTTSTEVDFVDENGNNNPTVVTSFGSTTSTWAAPEIEKAFENNLVPEVMIGYDLTKKVNRGEFAAIAVQLYETLSKNSVSESTNCTFLDITNDNNEKAIKKAYKIDVAQGTSATTYEPLSNINREQLATMLCRVIKKYGDPNWTMENDSEYYMDISGVQKFADDNDISNWAKPSVYFMAKFGIIKGVSDTLFAPKNTNSQQEASGYASATREQAIILAQRIFTQPDIFLNFAN